MSRTVHRAPLAVASDGAILVNLHHLDGDVDPQRLIELARRIGGVVFVGIVARSSEIDASLQQFDTATTAVAAALLGERMREAR